MLFIQCAHLSSFFRPYDSIKASATKFAKVAAAFSGGNNEEEEGKKSLLKKLSGESIFLICSKCVPSLLPWILA